MPAEGNNIIRPRSFSAPPPLPDAAEALYYEGMAAYQHRNWELALDRFTRLKELQPSRPGWTRCWTRCAGFCSFRPPRPSRRRREFPPIPRGFGPAYPLRLRRWQTWGLILLGLVGVIALLLFAGRRLPWTTGSGVKPRNSQSRAGAAARGRLRRRSGRVQELLEIAPASFEAQSGLAHAQRQQTLAQGYAAAEAAIAEEDWDEAAPELEKILAIDPGYSDAQAKSDFVAQRQRLAGLYADGSRLYDLGQWEDAIAQFEKTRELDSSYRAKPWPNSCSSAT